jgi:putative MATE family efflux protein
MFDVGREEITGGSIPRTLLLLAAPLVAQNFALVAQEVVDLFWVGRLNADAVAAVGLDAVLVGVLVVPVMAFSTGTQVVTSQRVGSDDLAVARRLPFNATVASVALAAVLGAAVYALADPIVTVFVSDPTVVGYAVDYLRGWVFALVAIAASDTLEGGFNGWGDTRAALYINLTSIGINVVLDPFLILGWGPFPRWEVFGAAVATAVGNVGSVVLALALVYRGRQGFELSLADYAPSVEDVRDVVEVGAPVAGQQSGRHVARLLIIGIVSAAGGAAGLAAYHIGSRVATVAFVPASGLGRAATSVVGQNLGAEEPARARRTTWVAVAVGAGGLSAFAVVQYLFPAAIAQVFVPELSGQTLAFSVLYLQILTLGYPALGAIYTVQAGFNGASRTKVSMYSTLLQFWAVRLPVAAGGAYLLDLGVAAVFWAVTVSNVAAALWLAGYYHYSAERGMLDRAAEEAAAPGD